MRPIQVFQRLTFAIALLFTAQVLVTGPMTAEAAVAPAQPAAAATSTAGGWIIGGIFISVASIIACAMIVGAEENREMELEEALLSGAIPLGCLLREELGVSPE